MHRLALLALCCSLFVVSAGGAIPEFGWGPEHVTLVGGTPAELVVRLDHVRDTSQVPVVVMDSGSAHIVARNSSWEPNGTMVIPVAEGQFDCEGSPPFSSTAVLVSPAEGWQNSSVVRVEWKASTSAPLNGSFEVTFGLVDVEDGCSESWDLSDASGRMTGSIPFVRNSTVGANFSALVLSTTEELSPELLDISTFEDAFSVPYDVARSGAPMLQIFRDARSEAGATAWNAFQSRFPVVPRMWEDLEAMEDARHTIEEFARDLDQFDGFLEAVEYLSEFPSAQSFDETLRRGNLTRAMVDGHLDALREYAEDQLTFESEYQNLSGQIQPMHDWVEANSWVLSSSMEAYLHETIDRVGALSDSQIQLMNASAEPFASLIQNKTSEYVVRVVSEVVDRPADVEIAAAELFYGDFQKLDEPSTKKKTPAMGLVAILGLLASVRAIRRRA